LHEQCSAPAAHPGTGAQAHPLLLTGGRNVDDIWIAGHEVEQSLQVDAWNRGGKVYACALEAAVDGKAGIHCNNL